MKQLIKDIGQFFWRLVIIFWLSYAATLGAVTATKHTGITIGFAYKGEAA